MSELTKMVEMEKDVVKLVRKAAEAEEAVQALQYSQAACNVANALVVLSNIKSS